MNEENYKKFILDCYRNLLRYKVDIPEINLSGDKDEALKQIDTEIKRCRQYFVNHPETAIR